MRRLSIAAILALIAPLVLSATQTPKDEVQQQAAPLPPGGMNQALPEIKGVVSWRTLGQVEEVTINRKLVPKFSTEIIALENKEVKFQGFMMPLEPGKKHRRFLLSANVPSCPFCMPGGPESLIEVLCKEPITFNMEPIVISGKLSVLKDDPTGLWYRVTDAALVSGGKM
jgi:hypothetical protein